MDNKGIFVGVGIILVGALVLGVLIFTGEPEPYDDEHETGPYPEETEPYGVDPFDTEDQEEDPYLEEDPYDEAEEKEEEEDEEEDEQTEEETEGNLLDEFDPPEGTDMEEEMLF